MAAKAAHDEIVRKAMERTAVEAQVTRQEMQETREQAAREAQELVQRARQQGQHLIDEAQRSSEEIVAAARAARDDVLADLISRRTALEEELDSYRRQLEVVEGMFAAISGVVDGSKGRMEHGSTGSGTPPPAARGEGEDGPYQDRRNGHDRLLRQPPGFGSGMLEGGGFHARAHAEPDRDAAPDAIEAPVGGRNGAARPRAAVRGTQQGQEQWSTAGSHPVGVGQPLGVSPVHPEVGARPPVPPQGSASVGRVDLTPRIIFLCTGNMCRSPVAEALLRRKTAEIGVSAAVRSAGLGPPGRRAPPSAVEVLRRRGIDLRHHRSAQVTSDLLRQADLVLGMGSDHLDAVVKIAPDVSQRAFALKELVRWGDTVEKRLPNEGFEAWVARVHAERARTGPVPWFQDETIADPLGQAHASFEQMTAELEALLDRFIGLAWSVGNAVVGTANGVAPATVDRRGLGLWWPNVRRR